MNARRHKWSEPNRFPFKTERVCQRPGCGLIKVTRHEPGEHPWVEWWRAPEEGAVPVKIGTGSPRPACQGTHQGGQDSRQTKRAA